MSSLAATAKYMSEALDPIPGVDIVAAGTDLPLVCFRLDPVANLPFDVFALSEHLRLRGWVVPAYRMAPDAEATAVLRIVVREGLSRDMAGSLVSDIKDAIAHLSAHPLPPNVQAQAHKANKPKTKAPC